MVGECGGWWLVIVMVGVEVKSVLFGVLSNLGGDCG